MFSDRIKARLAGFALAGAVIAMPAAAMAGVVVKASGPSADRYSVGTQLDDNSSITLRAGDKITVLVEGGTRVMEGPGTFRVGEGASRTRARFSQLTRRGSQRRVRTGAVRGADGDGPSLVPNIWFVNVMAPGNMCLYDLDRVRLWRPQTDVAQTFRIVDQATQATLEVNFVDNEEMRVLDPTAMNVVNGGTYSIMAPTADEEEGPGDPVTITVVELAGELDRPDMLAAALAEAGCTSQLTRLGETAEAEAL